MMKQVSVLRRWTLVGAAVLSGCNASTLPFEALDLARPTVDLAEAKPDLQFQCGDPVDFVYAGERVSYGTVRSPSGLCWLDRNLGARRRTESFGDSLAFGDYFQWGRRADGHQVPSSPTTEAQFGTDVPDSNAFVISHPEVLPQAPDNPPTRKLIDWRNPASSTLWDAGHNDPCPDGFRVPTKSDWDLEIAQASDPFNSALRLVAAGVRWSNGVMYWAGEKPLYWSSTLFIDGMYGLTEHILGGWNTGWQTGDTLFRACAMPIRCVRK